MPATIREVAREAGVSIATVSRVLNGKGQVAEATRALVEAAARRLRYSPDGAAQSLITRRTMTLGVLLPELYGEFFSEFIRGLDLSARGRGYHLLVSSSHSDRREIEAMLRAMRGRVDGIVVMSPDADSSTLVRAVPETIPLVLVNPSRSDERFDVLAIDNYGGAYAITRHLLGLGHRHLAFITGPANNVDALERLRGFRAAVKDLAADQIELRELEGDFREESGYRAGRALLNERSRPTAVFAANDAMAIGALSAFHEAAVRVPDDIALAGFDDIPIARFVAPPLTTVRVAIRQLGERAVERLCVGIDARNGHERRLERVATELVVRASCGGGGRPAAVRRLGGDALGVDE
ncbi:MAG: LacI family DNA-binding transcriptional regulator [Acidobacteriota bacterium]|jgi:LacI family transcriptional regulator